MAALTYLVCAWEQAQHGIGTARPHNAFRQRLPPGRQTSDMGAALRKRLPPQTSHVVVIVFNDLRPCVSDQQATQVDGDGSRQCHGQIQCGVLPR